ncbi:hypothetical protein RND71_028530 [Anisodus tanguticus]|uniref:Uncharacterized protein n=1 Tax=Anisodus tanguticus TaxID=243964 RepID=A0AAE1RLM3_9SOLA|nr:hypothetical protein RND71_028530 [Anisodus tanguticus]
MIPKINLSIFMRHRVMRFSRKYCRTVLSRRVFLETLIDQLRRLRERWASGMFVGEDHGVEISTALTSKINTPKISKYLKKTQFVRIEVWNGSFKAAVIILEINLNSGWIDIAEKILRFLEKFSKIETQPFPPPLTKLYHTQPTLRDGQK